MIPQDAFRAASPDGVMTNAKEYADAVRGVSRALFNIWSRDVREAIKEERHAEHDGRGSIRRSNPQAPR